MQNLIRTSPGSRVTIHKRKKEKYMSFFTWDASYSNGIQSIDDQHRKLIKLADELFEAMKSGKGKEVIGKVLSSLIDYTVTHFTYEEKLMQTAGYPLYLAHHKIHQDLVRKVKEFHEKFQTGNTMLTVELMNFLKTWLIDHIKGEDRKYAPYLIEKGVK